MEAISQSRSCCGAEYQRWCDLIIDNHTQVLCYAMQYFTGSLLCKSDIVPNLVGSVNSLGLPGEHDLTSPI